ncbi:TetR/AcrR family transcriptional regulator [Nesterenkonia halotolerans]|uniref:AcrR family transcriptional regulator n=1 Tax=Nesterenkonia halotolerans TaxID=225325 RepID=A0ABR9J9Z6_9MICC|nr:TetR/AcrR family transcriptional regulator [Nesterenkonia halotolerans]MBE1515822.1 AcrR family transcriptional regulator [Nesterenkonia halotolerans]
MTETPPRQRDAVRTRAEVLAVATEVFADDGYSGARIDEIARRTRTTKRMIYYYFGGKEQLYMAVLDNAYRGIRKAEQTLQVDEMNPIDALRELAELTYEHHLRNSAFIRLVSIENIHRGKYIRKLESLSDLGQPAVTILDGIIAQGKKQGAFREEVNALDLHLLISSYCVFQIANRYTFSYLFDPDFTTQPRQDRMRGFIGDVVVAWATAPTPPTR